MVIKSKELLLSLWLWPVKIISVRSFFGRHGRTDILDGNQTLMSLVTRYGYNRLKLFKVLRIRFSFIKNNADI